MVALFYFLLIEAVFVVIIRFGSGARSNIASPHDGAHPAEGGTFLSVMR